MVEGVLKTSIPTFSPAIGASWWRDTVVSFPSGSFTWAYRGLQSRSSTVSTSGMYLDALTFLFKSTGLGDESHCGSVVPVVDFLLYLKSLSWGVSFIAVHSKDLPEWSESSRTDSHWEIASPLVLSARVTVFHKVPFSLSTWPFPFGLNDVLSCW